MYILFFVGHCFQLKIKTDKGVMGSFSFMLLCCFLPRHRLIPPTSNRKGWRRLKTRIGCQWSRARIWWGKIWSSNRKPFRTKQQLRTANTTWKTIVTVSGTLYNLVCLFLVIFYISTLQHCLILSLQVQGSFHELSQRGRRCYGGSEGAVSLPLQHGVEWGEWRWCAGAGGGHRSTCSLLAPQASWCEYESQTRTQEGSFFIRARFGKHNIYFLSF